MNYTYAAQVYRNDRLVFVRYTASGALALTTDFRSAAHFIDEQRASDLAKRAQLHFGDHGDERRWAVTARADDLSGLTGAEQGAML